jgi:type I restriction enzyme S subunit
MERNSLPNGWRRTAIRDIVFQTKQRDPSKCPNKPFRYVDVSSIDNTSFTIQSATELMGSQAPSRARRDIQTGDVLFATVRPTLMRIALVPEDLNGQIASTGYCVLRANRGIVDNRFLYYWLLTDKFIQSMGNLQRGASYPAVRDTDVLNAPIPISERKRRR